MNIIDFSDKNINLFEINFLLKKVGISSESYKILLDKINHKILYIDNISSKLANIVKQTMLSIGGDVSVNRDVAMYKESNHPILIFGTMKQIKILVEKLKLQPFKAKDLAFSLEKIVHDEGIITKIPKIFGILNITEDSFFDGGKYNTLEKIEERIEFMIENGIKYIDIGAMSSRPYSDQNLSEKEEIDKLLMAIDIVKKLDKKDEITISCDTYRANVADICLENGAKIINDIYGTNFDKNMPLVLKKHDAKIIIMHMKGTPKDMQKSINLNYENVISEILEFFEEKIKCLVEFGIKRENIILDPGIGFGKNLEHNLEILKNINIFKIFNLPIFIGHSRKSFIGEILNKDVNFRLFGTLGLSMYLFMKGIDYIRVHDIKEHMDLLKIFKVLR